MPAHDENYLTYVYNFVCQHKGCTYSRRMGHARVSAETLATSHALRKRHNVIVYVSDLSTLLSSEHLVIKPDSNALDMFDQPPF